jgi:triosephosphate isomerase
MQSKQKTVKVERKRKYFVGANWKCNGTISFAKEIVNHLINDVEYDKSKMDLMVLPGFLHLTLVKAIVNEGILVGA